MNPHLEMICYCFSCSLALCHSGCFFLRIIRTVPPYFWISYQMNESKSQHFCSSWLFMDLYSISSCFCIWPLCISFTCELTVRRLKIFLSKHNQGLADPSIAFHSPRHSEKWWRHGTRVFTKFSESMQNSLEEVASARHMVFGKVAQAPDCLGINNLNIGNLFVGSPQGLKMECYWIPS